MNLSKLKLAVAIGIALIVSGCGTQMRTVMRDCDTGSSFEVYASCIKTTYAKEGTYPNAASIRAFYANLDALTELHAEKKLSNAQAKAAAYEAFMRTVQADNDRSSDAFSSSMSALQNMPQGTVQPSQLNSPTRTRCIRSGNALNCTSY